MRKIAYGLLAALFIAGAIFFFFGGSAIFRSRHGVKLPVVRKIPPAGVVSKKFPLPKPSVLPGQCPLPPGHVLPAPAPVVPGTTEEVKKAAPVKPLTKFNENYDKLIDRILRKKSTNPPAATGDLLEIPLPDSGAGHN